MLGKLLALLIENASICIVKRCLALMGIERQIMDDLTPEGRYGLGRVAFKAHLETIRKEVEAAYPLTTIYSRHKDKLGITYSQFRRHVNRYILQQPATTRQPKSAKPETPVPETKPRASSNVHVPKNFEFNPVAPDYGDLI